MREVILNRKGAEAQRKGGVEARLGTIDLDYSGVGEFRDEVAVPKRARAKVAKSAKRKKGPTSSSLASLATLARQLWRMDHGRRTFRGTIDYDSARLTWITLEEEQGNGGFGIRQESARAKDAKGYERLFGERGPQLHSNGGMTTDFTDGTDYRGCAEREIRVIRVIRGQNSFRPISMVCFSSWSPSLFASVHTTPKRDTCSYKHIFRAMSNLLPRELRCTT